jgi:DNA-binding response OmpR family regulator
MKESAALRVLVVDDEALIRWAVVETLTQAGDVVLEAADGAAALRTLAACGGQVDVVLLDLCLPDCRDLTLLSGIRRISPAAVVMMTAFACPEVVCEAARLGVDRIIGKPFDLREVMAAVHRAAGSPPTPGIAARGPMAEPAALE